MQFVCKSTNNETACVPKLTAANYETICFGTQNYENVNCYGIKTGYIVLLIEIPLDIVRRFSNETIT